MVACLIQIIDSTLNFVSFSVLRDVKNEIYQNIAM